MATTAAADDMVVSQASDSLKCGERGIDIPKGHTGRTLLSGTGRAVWLNGARGQSPALRATAPSSNAGQ